jgi:ubiquinone/menaquinone biosynthesis C-methylase UbiE
MSSPEYYARLNEYILSVDLPWSVKDATDWEGSLPELAAIFGPGAGRRVLDCSCGWGKQAIALAKLGWQVTATDISPTSLNFARRAAHEEEVTIDFRLLDMRYLAETFHSEFDWVVTGYALYELDADEAIQHAVSGMFQALKPGGQCYLIQRDHDELMDEKPRHEFHGEKRTPTGRVFCIGDWEYESTTHVIELNAFLREDETKEVNDHFRWTTETIGVRKRVLYKADLVRFFQKAGFELVKILPKPSPWMEVQLVATKPA